MANFTIRTIALNDVRFDLSPRIFTNASEFCPVNEYKIEYIIDQFTNKKYSKHWEDHSIIMFKNGTIDLYGINYVMRMKVWVTVDNGEVWLSN